MSLKVTRYLMMLMSCLLLIGSMTLAQQTETPTPETDTEMVTPEETVTYVRFAHFAPEVDGVDVFVNGEAIEESNLTYPNISDWILLENSVNNLAVTPTGGTVNDAILTFDEVELGRGFVTVLVLPDASGQASLYAIARNAEESLLYGTSGITFVNALTSDVPVNFDRDGVPFVTELGNATDRALYLPVDTAPYTFRAYNPFDTEGVTFGEETEIELTEGSYYIVAVVGSEDNAQIIVHETTGAEHALALGTLAEPGTINQAILTREDQLEYESVINTAGLTETLGSEGPYTLLLPAGFLIDEILAAVGDDNELLANTLQNHLIEGQVTLVQLAKLDSVTTLAGNTYDVVIDGNTVAINGLRVLVPNLYATNGVVHVIDGILPLPEIDSD